MFYLFHSPDVSLYRLLNSNNGRSSWQYPFGTLLNLKGAQHHQSQQEDVWSLQSIASSLFPHKQYPGLQRYHPETVPVTVSTQVQPQEQAGSLRQYHPEPVPVTDSEQVSQKQPGSLHHALSRVTGTVETFPRFVHLSVLWLVINTAVLVLCMWKNERQSGYQMLPFNADCTHLLLFYFLCMHLPHLTPPSPTRSLSWFVLCLNQPLQLFLAARTTYIIFVNSLLP